MAARGVSCVWADGDARNALEIQLTGANRFDYATEDITIAGWMQIIGIKPSPINFGEGDMPMSVVCAGSFQGAYIYVQGLSGSAPFALRGETYNGTPPVQFTAGASELDYGENYYYVLTWNHLTNTWSRYFGPDGGALSAATTQVVVHTGNPFDRIWIGCKDNTQYGANAQFTNYKVWKRLFDSTELTAEKESEDPVITTGLLAHWKLPSSSDLSDSSGNGLAISALGTVGDGDMDPVDIQDAVASHRIFIVS